MKTAALIALVSLAFAPGAEAKYRIQLTLSDPSPAVSQPVRVVLRTDASQREGILRLLAVPPGVYVDEVLDSERRFRVRLVRVGTAWRGTVRFRRPGRWLLIVPNWGAPGYAIPPPVVRTVLVRAR